MDTPLVRPGLTYEDLLALPHRGRRCEIFDGVLFESPVPSLPHQRTAQRLTRVFEEAVRDGSGVLSSGMDVVLADGHKSCTLTPRGKALWESDYPQLLVTAYPDLRSLLS